MGMVKSLTWDFVDLLINKKRINSKLTFIQKVKLTPMVIFSKPGWSSVVAYATLHIILSYSK